MTEPGKRGGGFKPGGAADRVVKKRAAKLRASQDVPTIKSVEDVEAIFKQLAAIFDKHGEKAPSPTGRSVRQIDTWVYEEVATSRAGPFAAIQGVDLIVFFRPDMTKPKFGWMERIDIRRGSPTAMATLLEHLKRKGLTP